jgi:hypothetical protein
VPDSRSPSSSIEVAQRLELDGERRAQATLAVARARQRRKGWVGEEEPVATLSTFLVNMRTKSVDAGSPMTKRECALAVRKLELVEVKRDRARRHSLEDAMPTIASPRFRSFSPPVDASSSSEEESEDDVGLADDEIFVMSADSAQSSPAEGPNEPDGNGERAHPPLHGTAAPRCRGIGRHVHWWDAFDSGSAAGSNKSKSEPRPRRYSAPEVKAAESLSVGRVDKCIDCRQRFLKRKTHPEKVVLRIGGMGLSLLSHDRRQLYESYPYASMSYVDLGSSSQSIAFTCKVGRRSKSRELRCEGEYAIVTKTLINATMAGFRGQQATGCSVASYT